MPQPEPQPSLAQAWREGLRAGLDAGVAAAEAATGLRATYPPIPPNPYEPTTPAHNPDGKAPA